MVINLLLILFYVFQSDVSVNTERLGGSYYCPENKYTFMVAIIRKKNNSHAFVGGGTLLSELWVLTTALHLRDYETEKNYMVVAGISSLSEFYSKNKFMQTSLIIHGIRSGDLLMEYLEIALLKLAQPISKSKSVSYVRLAEAKDIKGKKLENICANATVVGYGNQRDDEPSNFNERTRHCAHVAVISYEDCRMRLKSFPIVVPQQGCIFEPEVNICYSDTGGPIICNDIQYGVITVSYACIEQIPSIFSRVDSYEKFFKSKLGNIHEKPFKKKSKCSSNNIVNLLVSVLPFILYLVTNYKFC